MTALISTRLTILARAYAGDWLVDCPRCNSAEVRGFGDPVWDCPDCGARLGVVWPSTSMRHGVERLLMMRPLRHTRNWFPHESLHDLLAENIEHGIVPALGEALAIVGDKITVDTLPASPERRQIGA